VTELLKEADALLYDAKAAGKDAARFRSASQAVR
jgi:PleD family two-component response regulator